jgi:hypothetical protein
MELLYQKPELCWVGYCGEGCDAVYETIRSRENFPDTLPVLLYNFISVILASTYSVAEGLIPITGILAAEGLIPITGLLACSQLMCAECLIFGRDKKDNCLMLLYGRFHRR